MWVWLLFVYVIVATNWMAYDFGLHDSYYRNKKPEYISIWTLLWPFNFIAWLFKKIMDDNDNS